MTLTRYGLNPAGWPAVSDKGESKVKKADQSTLAGSVPDMRYSAATMAELNIQLAELGVHVALTGTVITVLACISTHVPHLGIEALGLGCATHFGWLWFKLREQR